MIDLDLRIPSQIFRRQSGVGARVIGALIDERSEVYSDHKAVRISIAHE